MTFRRVRLQPDRCVWIAIIALVVLAVPLRATVLIPADVGDLTRDAIVIARGRVASTGTRWADDRRGVETTVTLDVDAYLKGSLGPTLQFRVPGGELGRFRSIVVGAPEFAVDEHVIVFLGARGPTVPYVLGLNQGVFRLARTVDRESWLVTSPAIFPGTVTTRVARGDAARRPLPIADFEQRVRALAAGGR